MTAADDVIQVAASQLGMMERPVNDTVYGAEFGMNYVPWCVIFLWWCFRQAGHSGAFCGGQKTASCTHLLSRSNTVPLDKMQPGDIVILTFRSDRQIQHCGLVVKVNHSQQYAETIEGNTSTYGMQDNGGSVLPKIRNYANIVAVIRPDWEEEEAMPDCNGRYQTLEACPDWAQPTIKMLMDREILRGYDWGLNLSEDMCRILVMLDRAEVFRHD